MGIDFGKEVYIILLPFSEVIIATAMPSGFHHYRFASFRRASIPSRIQLIGVHYKVVQNKLDTLPLTISSKYAEHAENIFTYS